MDKINDLFDISHQNPLDKIKTVEGRLFLNKQRKKGRPSLTSEIDWKLVGVEKRKLSHDEKKETPDMKII